MRVDQFDFDLPSTSIALRPAVPRDSARLLVVGADEEVFADSEVSYLSELLQPGDAVVLNDTKVIPAQLFGKRQRGGITGPEIGITLLAEDEDNGWMCFAKPGRKLQLGDMVTFQPRDIAARVIEKFSDGRILFRFNKKADEFHKEIQAIGQMPLPPYIASKRCADDRDFEDYQTIYAQSEGSVAAPTAGLHFSEKIFTGLAARGIEVVKLTLHVGAGTFLPVKCEDTSAHHMHGEWGEISSQAAYRLNDIKKRGGRIIAVGTTALRLLETAAVAPGKLAPFKGETDIFITPGYRFRAVDGLVTNFHLPRSTLFMLVSAFSGLERMKQAYAHAIKNGYRFYSYGDASLLWRSGR